MASVASRCGNAVTCTDHANIRLVLAASCRGCMWMAEAAGGAFDLCSHSLSSWRGGWGVGSVGFRQLHSRSSYSPKMCTMQAVTLGYGQELEWAVQSRHNGYSLGNIVHSLTLAPRQTRCH